MAETKLQTSLFEFTGNHLCLDFTNTVHNRFSNPEELLNSYNDLLLWSHEAHLLTEDEALQLREKAEHHRKEAEVVLQRAINLREALYRIFQVVAQGFSPEKSDLSTLNTEFSLAMGRACIMPAKNSFTLDWTDKEKALDRMLWTIARSAVDLLTSEGLDDVRVCAADDCNWLFLDTSKNHSRRWCDMKSCGNRAKVRKHYNSKKISVQA